MEEFMEDVDTGIDYNTMVVELDPQIAELESRLHNSGDPGILVDKQQLQDLLQATELDTAIFNTKQSSEAKVIKDLSNVENEEIAIKVMIRTLEEQAVERITAGDIIGEGNSSMKMRSFEGGMLITADMATELRMITLGTTIHPICKEWKNAGLLFQNIDGPFAYGLHIQKNCPRGLQLCIQAFILKCMLFSDDEMSQNKRDDSILYPSSTERRQALIGALTDILWQAAEGGKCCVVLIQDKPCYTPTSQLKHDGITEKLHVFEFTEFGNLKEFIRKYINYFELQSSHGCMLFLYSLILSRTITGILKDAGQSDLNKEFMLLGDKENCTLPLLNLLLTGRATKYLHNGNIEFDRFGELLPTSLIGVKKRSQVGLLYWNTEERDKERTDVGSMLKTPKYPMWVTMVNGHIGLLFSLNYELISDWRAEHVFQLVYYNGLPQQEKHTSLEIDTRYGRIFAAKTALQKREEEKKVPLLEWCIMSKWFGAEVDWKGLKPFT